MSARAVAGAVTAVVAAAAAASVEAPSQGELLGLSPDGSLSGELAAGLARSAPLSFAPDPAGGGLVFNVEGDLFRATEALPLPRAGLSMDAWVAVETPQRWGGILGAVEDNGSFEKGWVFGYDDSAFTFGLSTEATDDGDGHLVYLRADVPYRIGGLHHVAATYDGETARLFVDGRIAASSGVVGGAIVMADSARLVIGAYADSDELFVHDGRIAALSLVDRAWTPSEVAARAASLPELARAEPWTDAQLEWLVAPYLTWPRPDGVSVLAETTTLANARLRVREATRPDWREVEPVRGAPDRLHEFVVRGLAPSTKYFYDVSATGAIGGRQQTTITSGTRSFRTAPPEVQAGDWPEAFTFTVLSDTQTQGDVAARVAALAYEHRPNFVVHCGDLVDTGSKKSDWTETFFPSVRPLIEHAPLVSVLGNHEQDARLYYDYLSLPAPERWYSLRYGNAEFFLLDGNRSLADQSEQLRWLKGALADSTATWRFAVLHQPPYTSDSDDYGDTTVTGSTRGDPNVRNILATLERHGVDLCFSGHVHDYERTFPILDGAVVPYSEGGIVYVTAAGAGGGLEDFDPTNTWFGHKKMRRHHFVHVAIHGDRLELQAMDEDGRLFDVFELRQRGR